MGSRINRHRQELTKLQAEVTEAKESFKQFLTEQQGVTANEQIAKLEREIQKLNEARPATDSVTQDLQYQIDELKQAQENSNNNEIKELKEEIQKLKDAAKSSFQRTASCWRFLETVIMAGKQSSTEELGKYLQEVMGEDSEPKIPAKEAQKDEGEISSSQTSSESSQTEPQRKVYALAMPSYKLGPITNRPFKYIVKTQKRTNPIDSLGGMSLEAIVQKQLTENEATSVEVKLTSNNINTQGSAPGETVEVLIEHSSKTFAMRVPKTTTSRELRQRIRKELRIPEESKLNVLYTQHKTIEDDDKSLWSLGMRFIPNHVAIIPDQITKGDLARMAYLGKGKNVNGTYEPICKKTGYNQSTSWK